jgi:RNA polymerase sigma factor (sigma-70 family)
MRPGDVQQLYEKFGYSVYRRCLYLLREEQRAMDMTQDTFVAALDKVISFSSDGKAGAWLLKVATNRCLNELRRQKYWRSHEMLDGSAWGATSPIELVEDRMVFQKLLATLSPQKATVVVGYFLEGKTMEEVAAETGYSYPTVRRTVSAFLDKGRRQRTSGSEERADD